MTSSDFMNSPDSDPSPGPPPKKGIRGLWSLVLQSLRGGQHDLTAVPLRHAILLLAVPMVLEMAMESVFAVCDIFFVSRLGAEAVATVGLTESMLTILYAVAIGLSMATTATVARRIGEKEPSKAASVGAQAIYLGIFLAVLIGAPCFFYARELLGLMGASAETVDAGAGYTRVMLGFNIVIMLIFLNNAVFRGAGDAAVAMRSLWIANIINIVLDPCLIFGVGPFPEMGVTGAAVATTIGRGTGVLYQFWAMRRQGGHITILGDAWRWNVGVMVRLVRLSLGGIGQFLVATASWVALMRIVSIYGSNALAGYTISIRIIMFALLPSWGLSNAAATLVGQNLGAKRPDRAEKAVWFTGLYNMAFLGLVTVLFVLFARPIVGVFTQDEAIASVGISSLRIISYGYIFYAWGMVLIQSFNGAGDTMTPTWINLFCFWVLQIPMAWVLARVVGLGPEGVFWSVAGAESVLATVAFILYKRGGWKHKQV